jgi:hypothetical protein
MPRWLPEWLRPTGRGVVENVVANALVYVGAAIITAIAAAVLASIAAPRSDADWVNWFLSALLSLGCFWVLYAVGWRIRFQGWPQPSQGVPPEFTHAAIDPVIADDLCKLEFLKERHAQYKKHLDDAWNLQESIEEAFRNPDLRYDKPERWEPVQRLLETWGNALRGTGHAYQTAFGRDYDLSLSTSWKIGQTPIQGQSAHTANGSALL